MVQKQQGVVAVDNVLPFMVTTVIPSMSEAAISQARTLEEVILKQSQIEFLTQHILHGGIYLRTVYIPAGVVMSMALIKIPTTVILNGHCSVYVGEDRPLEFDGHNILPASAGRKVAVYAHTDVEMTMLFPTDVKSVEEAEAQFTDETDMLASHKDGNMNSILITGE
jgi:hypothetical protein